VTGPARPTGPGSHPSGGRQPGPAAGPGRRLALGLDLGGTTLNGLLVDDTGRILARRRRDTPVKEGPEAVLGVMRETAEELLAAATQAGAPGGPARENAGAAQANARRVRENARPAREDDGRASVAGLGLGIPGPIDTERGVCLFSPNLGWRNLDVASYFRRAFDLPVRLDNDVRVAALGEGWVGAARDFETFILLTVGTGIGSGVVLGGRLWRGPGFSAGEVGHIPIAPGPDAPLCGCGRRGCLEARASGTAIAREARLAVERGEKTSLAGILARTGRLSPRAVAEAARAGDAVARRVFEEAAGHLGTAVATAVNLFNPEAVIIGGGVAGAWDLLAPVLERAVAERTFPPNLKFLRGVFPAALGEDAGAVGAAGLVLAPNGRRTRRTQ